MVRRLITTYTMLTPERRRQIAEEIQERRAARITVGLPSDLPGAEEEEGEPLPELMEEVDPKEDEAKLPE